jgi:hypothetical protein
MRTRMITMIITITSIMVTIITGTIIMTIMIMTKLAAAAMHICQARRR